MKSGTLGQYFVDDDDDIIYVCMNVRDFSTKKT